MTHLSFGTMVDYVRGLGTAAARERVREHLSSCPPCEQAANRLARLAEIAWAEIDCSAPDEVIDEAIALFTSAPVPAAGRVRDQPARVRPLASSGIRRRPRSGTRRSAALSAPLGAKRKD